VLRGASGILLFSNLSGRPLVVTTTTTDITGYLDPLSCFLCKGGFGDKCLPIRRTTPGQPTVPHASTTVSSNYNDISTHISSHISSYFAMTNASGVEAKDHEPQIMADSSTASQMTMEKGAIEASSQGESNNAGTVSDNISAHEDENPIPTLPLPRFVLLAAA